MVELADKIALKIYEKYDSLGKSGKPVEGKEWTLLAGFLVHKNNDIDVVSLATGTKCIGSKSMCPNGLIINDSHAEVLGRRSFLRYLYNEIDTAKKDGESYIFSYKCTNDKCTLLDNIKFYFFTSHIPCGDASIIPMKSFENNVILRRGLKRRYDDINSEKEDNAEPDIHRTGAKPVKGESRQDPHGKGENYHIKGAVRIKPGRGDPTLSLSCSDKLARWIYVGVQGALLSQLIEEPVRISVLVIGGGCQYSKDILEESLINRSGSTYKPCILQSTKTFRHSEIATGTSRPSPASILWAKTFQEKIQVSVDGKPLGCTKKNKNKVYILECKREFLKKFLSIKRIDNLNLTYREAKDMAIEYQKQSKVFKETMGAWAESKLTTELFKISKEELKQEKN
ncbi:hypothetical protein O3M35_006588 [Rhynocoris fuscipes]|uniref:tRNA-specific adenosine deaminase 1 n=1 Tax=Rhynocoris fuscipes TaxID=488301 RepID=A0AAW1DEU7_9HEMI